MVSKIVKKNVIYVDICGTLYLSNTTFDFLNFYFSKNSLWTLFHYIYTSIIGRLINKTFINIVGVDVTRMLAVLFLKGIKRSTLELAAQNFYDNFLYKRRNKLAFDLLYELKEKNTLFLASATLDFIAEIISKNIGIPVAISTELFYLDNVCMGSYKEEVMGNKYDTLEKKNFCLDSYIVITDNISDAKLVQKSLFSYVFVNTSIQKKWNKIFSKNMNNIKMIHYA